MEILIGKGYLMNERTQEAENCAI